LHAAFQWQAGTTIFVELEDGPADTAAMGESPEMCQQHSELNAKLPKNHPLHCIEHYQAIRARSQMCDACLLSPLATNTAPTYISPPPTQFSFVGKQKSRRMINSSSSSSIKNKEEIAKKYGLISITCHFWHHKLRQRSHLYSQLPHSKTANP
jgi:hypothetical protein